MKKIMYVLAITLVIATLVITATASIPVSEHKTASASNSGGWFQRLINLFTGEEVDDDISDDGNINPTERDFGEWEKKEFNTVYQAENDGFVTAWIHADDYAEYGTLRGYTADYPPSAGDWSAMRACVTVCGYALDPYTYICEYNSIMIPVIEGDYWLVVFSSGSGGVLSQVYWLSGGSGVSNPSNQPTIR